MTNVNLAPPTSRNDRFEDEVRALTGRSLYLLAAIDRTNEALYVDRLLFEVIARAGHDLADKLKKDGIDFDRETSQSLETLVQGVLEPLRSKYDRCKRGRAAAAGDARLSEEDGVVSSYNDCIEALSHAYDGLHELVEALGEYDADLDTRMPEVFDSAEGLIAALRR